MQNYAIAIHGGAGTILKNVMTPEKELSYKNGLQDAIEAGESILKSGGSAFDAVESTIIQLENNIVHHCNIHSKRHYCIFSICC